MQIVLANGLLRFPNPEARISEYCEIEVYEGYDDRHNPTDQITKSDIEAANNLYAFFNESEASAILRLSGELTPILHKIPDAKLEKLTDAEFAEVKEYTGILIGHFLKIGGIRLAKPFKILHLKRPSLFPILDTYVVEFLTFINVQEIPRYDIIDLGLSALSIARNDIIMSQKEFQELQENLANLPIPGHSRKLRKSTL